MAVDCDSDPNKQPTTRLHDRLKPFDITVAVGIVEDMEQAAVDHRVKNFGKVFQGQGVYDQEGRRQAPLGSFLLRTADRFGQEVEARDLVAPLGEEESVLPVPQPASRIEPLI